MNGYAPESNELDRQPWPMRGKAANRFRVGIRRYPSEATSRYSYRSGHGAFWL